MAEESRESLSSRLYGRRKGRPLNKRKARLLQTLLPEVLIEIPEKAAIDPTVLFPSAPQSLWFEIGFGGGEHLAAESAQNPTVGFIGCEPFENGVAGLLDYMDRDNLTNIRIFPGDARCLLAALPDASLARVCLLYPDPWPKKRHAERRFINNDSLTLLARVLKVGGELLMATDVPTLAAWMEKHATEHPLFSCAYKKSTPPPQWIPTRYEQKGLEAGRKSTYLIYRRSSP